MQEKKPELTSLKQILLIRPSFCICADGGKTTSTFLNLLHVHFPRTPRALVGQHLHLSTTPPSCHCRNQLTVEMNGCLLCRKSSQQCSFFSFYYAFDKVCQLLASVSLRKNDNSFYCEFLFPPPAPQKKKKKFFRFIFELKLRAAFPF